MSKPKDELELARQAEQLYRRIQNASEDLSEVDAKLPTGVSSVLHLLATLQPRGHSTNNQDRESQDSVHETDLTIGRFRLSQYLGEGAHGVVYLADDTLFDRIVALKLPKPHVLFTPDLRMRFLREARAASGLHHPHIVQTYDASEADELSFIASEYCSGGSLRERLGVEGNGVIARSAACLIVDLSDAVHHAHQSGILHRDIKPSNIQLAPVENPIDPSFPFVAKITDFGLAKALASEEQQTKTGEVIGTVRYMAPELILGTHTASPTTDVYGLGIVLYELLCGKVPFDGKSEMAIFRKATQTQPINVADLCDVPQDLAAICMKSIEKDVQRRYTTAADLASDLRRFLAGEQTVARPIGPARKLSRWAKQNPMPASLLGLSVAGVLLGVLGLAYHNRRLGQAFDALSVQKSVSDIARLESDRNAVLADRRADLLATQQATIATAAYAADMNLAFQAFGGQLPRLAMRLLAQYDEPSHRQNDAISFDPRGFEWHLLKRMVNPKHTVLYDGLQAPHLAVSPLTESLVLVSKQLPAKVFDIDDLDHTWELSTLSQSREVAICPKTGRVAISHADAISESKLSIYSSAGEHQSTFGNQETTIESLRFSHSGELIASGARYSDIVISKTNGERVMRFENESRNEALAFSPDDHYFAFSSYDPLTDVDSVLVVETQTWSNVAKLPITRKDEVLCFSPDGHHLLISSNYQIDVYATNDFKRELVIDGARSKTSNLKFSVDGSLLVATTTDGVLRWWECEVNANSGLALNPLGIRSTGAVTVHDGRITSLACGLRNQIFTSGEDGRVVRTDLPYSSNFIGEEFKESGAAHMRISRKGHVVTALLDGRDVIFFPDGKQTVLQNHSDLDDRYDWLRRVAVSPDLMKVASFYGNHLSIAPLDGSPSVVQIDKGGPPLMDIEFVADNLLAIVEDERPYLTLCATDGAASTRSQFSSVVSDIEVVPSSRHIVVAVKGSPDSAGELCLYNWQKEEIIHRVPCTSDVMYLTLSGDGSTLAVGSNDGIVELYAMPELRKLRSIDSQLTQRMRAVAFSDDAKTMATGGDRGRLQLWQLETGRCLGTLLDNPDARIVGVHIQPDGAIICAFAGATTPVRKFAP